MKKPKLLYVLGALLIGLGLVGGIFSMGGVIPNYYFLASTNVDLPDQAEVKGVKRVLVTPKSEKADKELRGKSEVDVQHEFDGKFTANVPEAVISKLDKYAEVEELKKLKVHAKPVCGDGHAHKSEKCGEPGLSECPEGQECVNCKCTAPEEPPPSDRTCYPSSQREYNVEQVNGGQIGDGSGINVAILDTGAYTDHLDLDVKLCKDTTKRGVRNGCKDTIGHGTHVAGIVAANGGLDAQGIYGVAPSANLWILKVCYSTSCYPDDIAEAINYAADHGAHIINMSFGSLSESPLIKEAIDAHPEVLFVASAGNRGPGANTIEYPAAYPNVLAIAAHDAFKMVTSFSSRGIDDGNDSSIVEREVELSAGGRSVESTYKNGCYARMSGTSMSSPVLAGLAGLAWQGNAADTRDYLRTIAEDITQADGGGAEAGFDEASGYGMPIAP